MPLVASISSSHNSFFDFIPFSYLGKAYTSVTRRHACNSETPSTSEPQGTSITGPSTATQTDSPIMERGSGGRFKRGQQVKKKATEAKRQRIAAGETSIHPRNLEPYRGMLVKNKRRIDEEKPLFRESINFFVLLSRMRVAMMQGPIKLWPSAGA